MKKKLSEMGDSELQEYLLDSGYTQHVAKIFERLSLSSKIDTPLESYSFTIIDFSKKTRIDLEI